MAKIGQKVRPKIRNETQSFITDVVLPREAICNLDKDCNEINSLVEAGKKVIFAGRRNTGKTSLITSKVVPHYFGRNPKGLVLFVDLMGVKSISQIDRLFVGAFERAYGLARPARVFLKKMVSILSDCRPTFSVDPITGEASFSLALSGSSETRRFQDILRVVDRFHSEYGALIVLDEFQDIAAVQEAEARMREALQNLSHDLPVVVLGSKQHLLAGIFARPKAPFSNWGRYLTISNIPAGEYAPYINSRMKSSGHKLGLEQTEFLLGRMRHIPEAINLVCDFLQRSAFDEVNESVLLQCIVGVASERAPIYKRLLTFYSEKEVGFLRELAKVAPLMAAYSVGFISKVRMSTGSLRPLIRRLENDGIILKEETGYEVSDPLLAQYLIRS